MTTLRSRPRILLASILILFVCISTPRITYAQTCVGGCNKGYTCTYDSTQTAACLQNCSDGSKPDAVKGCVIDEFVVTGSKKNLGPTFAQWVDNTVIYFADTYIIPLLYALAFLVFIFGMFRYFFTGGEENREKGKSFAIWGIIGFVVIFGVWGIVNLLVGALPH